MHRIVVTLCALLVALTWSAVVHVPATLADATYTAVLTGTQQVPPNTSPATGSATVVLSADQTQIAVTVTFSGLTAPAIASHIHDGAPGTNGPVVIPFPGFPNATSGTYSQTFPITPALVAELQAGNLYINIHTATFPGGEIRGQLSLLLPTS